MVIEHDGVAGGGFHVASLGEVESDEEGVWGGFGDGVIGGRGEGEDAIGNGVVGFDGIEGHRDFFGFAVGGHVHGGAERETGGGVEGDFHAAGEIGEEVFSFVDVGVDALDGFGADFFEVGVLPPTAHGGAEEPLGSFLEELFGVECGADGVVGGDGDFFVLGIDRDLLGGGGDCLGEGFGAVDAFALLVDADFSGALGPGFDGGAGGALAVDGAFEVEGFEGEHFLGDVGDAVGEAWGIDAEMPGGEADNERCGETD